MSTIERIFQYFDFKGVKYTHAERELELSNGYLGKMKSRGASIGSEIIEKIVLRYQDINPEWLITGSGQMLRGSITPKDESNLPSGPCKQCELRDKIISQQAKTIALLEDKINGNSRDISQTG